MPQPFILCDYQSIIVRDETDALFDRLAVFHSNGAQIYFGTYAKGAEHTGQRQYMEHNYPGFISTVLGHHRHAHGFITPDIVGSYKLADRFWPDLCDMFAINAQHVIFLDNDPFALAEATQMGVKTIDTQGSHASLEKVIAQLNDVYAALTHPRDPSGTTGTARDAHKCRGRNMLDVIINKMGQTPN